ncbi:uncharacterized protein TRUGW13939_04933 [Talaromyces rugulosus]|uniref:methylmalonate-semialdehyde dehydrogenase (CoA acylating) n=1 Tax=Talaromyces rugulosus TaxID=121627 RepID=A0A7H8QYH7_TALRU|nr:uncharacterized protein TRUGW13939_04933 [Talaromyces rugulosus]QKX57813.1 hypothetical protein TRUGW13939_04933 [Talaromyces rugulosus]
MASHSLHISARDLALTSIVPPLTTAVYPMTHEKISVVKDTPWFTDNEFKASSSDKFIDVHDPATNNLVTRVPQNTDDELKAAVESANRAWPAWRDTSIVGRGNESCSSLLSLQDFADAKGDVLRGLQVAEQSCGITEQMKGELVEVATDMETRSYRIPLGIVAAICPSRATMILAKLCQKAGFPPGVVDVIHGTAKTVNFIIDEPEIKAISFVGGNRVGEYIYTRGSANGKRVQANLGAKNHAAILPDAIKSQALNAIVGAAFGAAGQRCMALSTLVAVGEAREWLDELTEKTKELSLDGGSELGADVGPVISPHSKNRIEELIASAEAEGATILLDGRGYKHPEPIPIPLPMFSFTGNKKSIAGGGASNFYGKPGLNFYTQLKTVTSLWKHENANLVDKVAMVMPTQG